MDKHQSFVEQPRGRIFDVEDYQNAILPIFEVYREGRSLIRVYLDGTVEGLDDDQRFANFLPGYLRAMTLRNEILREQVRRLSASKLDLVSDSARSAP